MINIKSLKNIWKGKKHIGMDIGAYYLKVVQLENIDNKLRLLKKNILNIRNSVGEADFGKKVQNFLQKKGYLSNGPCSVNIEDPSLIIRRMDLPKMPDRDLMTAVKWNFRELVDGSVDNYIVSFSHIKGITVSEKTPYCAYCIKREAVENLQESLKDIGVRLSSIEPNASALLSVFNFNVGGDYDKFYVMLDIGYAYSNFVVMGNGCLLFSRPLSKLSCKSLVEEVAREIGIVEKDAEEKLNDYLSQRGGEQSPENSKLAELDKQIEETASNFVSRLVVEVQRSIDAFCLMFNQEKVHKIFLCGGGVRLPDIADRFTKGLGVEAELFNPFRRIMDVDESVYEVIAPLYTVAVGLAIPKR